jgi:hypothetical protein
MAVSISFDRLAALARPDLISGGAFRKTIIEFQRLRMREHCISPQYARARGISLHKRGIILDEMKDGEVA